MHEGVQGPGGDVLEEIVQRGPLEFPKFLARLPAGPPTYRVSVLLGGLILGPEVREVSREVLRGRESRDKTAFLLGLGEIGHPEAEGYFARVLREAGAAEAAGAAVRCLGKIRGRRGFPLVLEAVNRDPLFAAACEALREYGGSEAVKALLPRAGEFPAFAALAALGAPEARDLFLENLQKEPPWAAEAARGVGRMGEADLGVRLVALIGAEDEPTAKAAFEAYASLGAPEGPQPLLEAASVALQPWMVSALGAVPNAEVERFLVAALTPPKPRGFWRKLLRWSREEAFVEPRLVYRALRGASDGEALAGLAARLGLESDPGVLRDLLAVRALAEDPRHGAALGALWKSGDLLKVYLAARALLEAPRAEFLAEALDFLGKPGFRELDGASPLADPEHLLDAYARDNNPFLLVGSFLDSGFADLRGLERGLAERLRSWAFPPESSPRDRFGAPEDGDLGAFLEVMGAAQPAARSPFARLWCLLADVEDGGGSLLDPFLCSTGAHRGGIQRALARGIGAALGRFIQGKTDQDLPELEAVMAHIPADVPIARMLRDSFGNARQALMIECRDMALMLEGIPRGDMVLVETF